MNIRTFTARTMAEAIELVRRDIGAGAVVLHTRTYRSGGVLGIGGKTTVEVIAADGREIGRMKQRNAPRRTPPVSLPAKPVAPPEVSATAGDLIRKTYAAARAELTSTRDPAADTVELRPAPDGCTAPPARDQLAEEMRTVKRMVARMMTRQQAGEAQGSHNLPDKLFDQYLALLEQEVAEELAQEIIQQVRTSLHENELNDDAAVARASRDCIAKLIPADPNTGRFQRSREGKPFTMALIGPTGVGKTTTIAKLAANFKLRQKRSVGLVTLDTYRIAAVDQLQTYADIIGVPLHVVTSPEEMLRVNALCRGCDVVLIDTAGRSQRDDPRLEQLHSFVKAASPHEVHLVLSSTCTQRVLLDTVERFSKIPTDSIIFTKLDEAVSFGVLLNVIQKVNKRLSFVTTGQEVPHQIEPGRGDRLAALLLGDQTLDRGAGGMADAKPRAAGASGVIGGVR